MSARDAYTRVGTVNTPVKDQTVYTPSPAAKPSQVAYEPPPKYTPPRPIEPPEFNPLWLIPIWFLLIGLTVWAMGWYPFTPETLPINNSVAGKPPVDKPRANAEGTGLAIAISTATSVDEATPLPVASNAAEAIPAVSSAPVGVLVDDTLPWYILKRSVPDASFEEFNGTLVELKAVPYQDLDVRGGADDKLCKIRTIYGSALVDLFVPCWRIGK